jgi:hypothetical protein
MSFNKNQEFQRQLDFQKERILEAITQHINIFEREELYGEFDNPVVFKSHDEDGKDEFITAVTKEGADWYQDGTGTFKISLDDMTNQQLILILKAMEETQEAYLTEKGVL